MNCHYLLETYADHNITIKECFQNSWKPMEGARYTETLTTNRESESDKETKNKSVSNFVSW